ncbi:MAG: hypothetical protein OHK0019_11760 [Saprospiraceae bacterium]
MTNSTPEALAAPRFARVQYEPATVPNRFFFNLLLLLVSIPAAVITLLFLLAMIPFRLPEMFRR